MTQTMACILVLVLSAVSDEHAMAQSRPTSAPSEEQFQTDAAAIDRWAAGSGNTKELESVLQGIDARWRAEPDRYARLIAASCRAIEATSQPANVSYMLLGSRAEQALAAKPDIPPADAVLIARYVEPVPAAPKGPNELAKWKEIRRTRSEMWAQAWARLHAAIDPQFDPTDLPELNVQPPSGSGARAGVRPDAIRDPVLRKEYEELIAQNNRRLGEYGRQTSYRRLTKRFMPLIEHRIVAAYAQLPADADELKRVCGLLRDDDMSNRILATVLKSTTKPTATEERGAALPTGRTAPKQPKE